MANKIFIASIIPVLLLKEGKGVLTKISKISMSKKLEATIADSTKQDSQIVPFVGSSKINLRFNMTSKISLPEKGEE